VLLLVGEYPTTNLTSYKGLWLDGFLKFGRRSDMIALAEGFSDLGRWVSPWLKPSTFGKGEQCPF
jgi:hypothetical protein